MNAILRFVTRQFEKGAVSKGAAQEAWPVTSCEDLEIVPDIQYQNHN